MLVVAVGNEYRNQIDGSILTNIIELHTEFHKLGHFFILFLQNPFLASYKRIMFCDINYHKICYLKLECTLNVVSRE